ncbi:MAG: UDP-glucose 4-epimerase GalE, partial [Bacteroidota bacterium]
MSKILVTGGLGYIGSHTVVELINKGLDVLIIDDLSNSHEDVLNGIEKITSKKPHFEQLNLTDFSMLKKVIEEEEIDSIIHFAAFKAVGESVEKPLAYYHNNVLSLINLLQVCEENDISKFVFSSSCTVYGQPDRLPVTEEFPKVPAESPYGNTKQICEEIIEDYCKANPDFKAISLRYFNPTGAHDSSLIGELPLGTPNNLVPYITQTAIGQRNQLNVFGGDYDTPDGT